MREGPPDPELFAWAAGLYDAEGSCSAYLPKKRRTYRRQMAVSQGGEPGKPPEVLLRFRSALQGMGTITGPYRGYLYYWKTSRKDELDAIVALLWPYLGTAKRLQFETASELAGRTGTLARDLLILPRPIGIAWAAGFFDGEGTVGVDHDKQTGRCRAIQTEVPQSSAAGIPDVLVRFRGIVGCGNITGPHDRRSPWSRLKRSQFEKAIGLRRTGSRVRP
jgi:hypothetical protein